MREAGYRIFTVPISRRMTDFWTHFLAMIWLYRFFRREKFDVLHVHTPIAAFLGRLAGWLAGVPLIIYTAHGFHFHDGMRKWQYGLFVFLERIAAKLTDFSFTQSDEDRQTAIKYRIARQEKIAAIGNGVDVDLFAPVDSSTKNLIREELCIPSTAVVVGIVCRMVREKGLVELLEAATTLGRVFPEAYFLFVGERIPSERDSSMQVEWQSASEQLGSRLIMAGYRPDVSRMMAAMDVFCLPSYREGMPRSIIEAMMMALPVVATNIRGSREEVVNEQTGLLVPVRNAYALTQALERLIADPALSRYMGGLGRQRALELYDERRVVARQIEIISTRSVHA